MSLQQAEHKTMDGFVVPPSPLGAGGISVIIPVFNEARTLSEIITRVLARPEVGQVIVVDDGSTDATGQLIAERRFADPRVTCLRHSLNRGKGSAIRTGLALATCPWVLIQDADLEYDPADYHTLWTAIPKTQHPVAVYGSRFLSPRSREPSKSPWVGLHRLGNRLLTGLSNLLLGQRLRRSHVPEIDTARNSAPNGTSGRRLRILPGGDLETEPSRNPDHRSSCQLQRPLQG